MITVLLVDDQIETELPLIERVLKHYEYRGRKINLIGARTQKEAHAILEEQAIDIALVDLRLDHMEGSEVIEKIVKNHDLPTIAISGVSSETDAIKAIRCGANDFVRKNNYKELPERLDIALDTYLKKKSAEEVLKESEESYRALFEESADGILIADIETMEFRHANPAICSFLGYTLDELSKRTVMSIHPKKSLEYVISEFKAQAEGEKTLAQELPCMRKDGTVVYADVNTTQVVIDGRRCNVGFFRDVTTHKKEEEERENLEKQLRTSQKMEAIGQLAGGIAHDFNNVLTVILSYAQFVKDQLPPYLEAAVEDNEQIIIAGKRAEDLVKQILSLSKSRETKDNTSLNITSLLKENMKFIRSAIPTTIEITEAYEGNYYIMGDPTKLHQIVMNLVTNAYQAMPDGGELSVSIARKDILKDNIKGLKKGEYCLLKVTDTGAGIPEEHLSKIFEPYFTTKSSESGTGLGLAIIWGIVTGMGGVVSIDVDVRSHTHVRDCQRTSVLRPLLLHLNDLGHHLLDRDLLLDDLWRRRGDAGSGEQHEHSQQHDNW